MEALGFFRPDMIQSIKHGIKYYYNTFLLRKHGYKNEHDIYLGSYSGLHIETWT